MKATVLCANDKCTNLLELSVYDIKPVHYLSIMCDSIQLIEMGGEKGSA